jgi:hypothetical protein
MRVGPCVVHGVHINEKGYELQNCQLSGPTAHTHTPREAAHFIISQFRKA